MRSPNEGNTTTPVSSRLWKSRGSTSDHSMDAGICGLAITARCEAKASHKIYTNIISAINDKRDPIEDSTFHFINASG